MRVLLQPFGSAGDVHPFVAIGRGLRARGHEVILFGNDLFRAVAERAGLEFVAVQGREEIEKAVRDPRLWKPGVGLRVLIECVVTPSLRRTVEAMEARLGAGDAVVAASTLGFAARIVRERRRVPLVTMHLAPAAFASAHRPPRLPPLPTAVWAPRWWNRLCMGFASWASDAVVAPALDRARADLGLAPVRGVFYRWLHSPDRVAALFPPWFAPPQPDWPPGMRLLGFPFLEGDGAERLDPALEAWLGAGAPPVVFTHGSANLQSRRFFEESAAAARLSGSRALLVGDPESMPRDLPAGVRAEAFAPFGLLLPRAAAAVSHGGVGTCARAFAAGVPHLAVPMSFDQFDNASRLDDLGTGAGLPLRRYRADRAARAIGALLGDSGVRDRCREVAARVAAEDGVAAACALVEEAQAAGATG